MEAGEGLNGVFKYAVEKQLIIAVNKKCQLDLLLLVI